MTVLIIITISMILNTSANSAKTQLWMLIIDNVKKDCLIVSFLRLKKEFARNANKILY